MLQLTCYISNVWDFERFYYSCSRSSSRLSQYRLFLFSKLFITISMQPYACVCRWAASVSANTLWQSVDFWDCGRNSASARRSLRGGVITDQHLSVMRDISAVNFWVKCGQQLKAAVSDFTTTNRCATNKCDDIPHLCWCLWLLAHLWSLGDPTLYNAQ